MPCNLQTSLKANHNSPAADGTRPYDSSVVNRSYNTYGSFNEHGMTMYITRLVQSIACEGPRRACKSLRPIDSAKVTSESCTMTESCKAQAILSHLAGTKQLSRYSAVSVGPCATHTAIPGKAAVVHAAQHTVLFNGSYSCCCRLSLFWPCLQAGDPKIHYSRSSVRRDLSCMATLQRQRCTRCGDLPRLTLRNVQGFVLVVTLRLQKRIALPLPLSYCRSNYLRWRLLINCTPARHLIQRSHGQT